MKTVIKTSLKSLLVVAAMAVYAPVASASLYVEPFLGYMMGNSKGQGIDKDTTGTDMGLRLGFSKLGFAVGGEFSQSNYEIDTNPSLDLKPTNLGIFAAYEFPILIRAYGTYIVSSKGDFADDIDIEGDGYRLGVGFTGLPFIAINFEYKVLKFDKMKGGGATVDVDLETKLYGVNVSLPLDLF